MCRPIGLPLAERRARGLLSIDLRVDLFLGRPELSRTSSKHANTDRARQDQEEEGRQREGGCGRIPGPQCLCRRIGQRGGELLGELLGDCGRQDLAHGEHVAVGLVRGVIGSVEIGVGVRVNLCDEQLRVFAQGALESVDVQIGTCPGQELAEIRPVLGQPGQSSLAANVVIGG